MKFHTMSNDEGYEDLDKMDEDNDSDDFEFDDDKDYD